MKDFLELARVAESDSAVLGVYADWLEENGQQEAALWLRDVTGESGFSDARASDALASHGYGNRDGYGSGSGDGQGDGYGCGYGYGDFYHQGDGYGDGNGYGVIEGSGDGRGSGAMLW